MSTRSVLSILAGASAAGLVLQRAQAETLAAAALIQDQTVQQGQLSAFVASLLQAAKHRLAGIADSLTLAPGEFARLASDVSTAMPTGNGIVTLTYGLILLIVGAGAAWLYWTYATPAVIALATLVTESGEYHWCGLPPSATPTVSPTFTTVRCEFGLDASILSAQAS